MRRWLERLSTLAIISLAVHLCAVTALRLFLPPPVFVAEARAVGVAPLLVARPDQPPPPVAQPLDDQLGEKTGTGESATSLDRPDPMQSETPHEFEQAWLRQRPSVTEQDQQKESSKKSSALVPSGIQAELPAMSPNKNGKGPSRTESTPSDRPTDTKASDGVAAEGQSGKDQKTNERTEANSSPTESAPAGQTDSDAFAKVEGISLIGGTKARRGREVRLTRPRIDLAFRAEMTRLQKRRVGVVFRITTDDSGRPRNVVTLRSSGSDQIDESVRLALFDSWFGGKMPDEFSFEVRFYED